VDIRLDEDVDSTDSVKLNLLILVLPPVSQLDKVGAASVIFLVSFSQNRILVKGFPEFATLVGLDPRVVVNCEKS